MQNSDIKTNAPVLSIGIIAWNEEDSICAALRSVFQQSLFFELTKRNLTCEIICVPNACTDATPRLAEEIFDDENKSHLNRAAFSSRVVHLPERGKLNAWNVFVHQLSSPQAQFLFLMDGDIILQHPETLWNMFSTLLENHEATIAVDRPLKDIAFKKKPSLLEKLSLATSTMTQASSGQLTGQLYCIRAGAARNIYLPKDLAACEDGFIKAIVCTDFLTHRVALPNRIVLAPNASHVFESYTSPRDILKNQKRQMIGQTIVHLLVDQHLQNLKLPERTHLGQWMREQDATDPNWLKRLIHRHLKWTNHFWQLFPGLLGCRFKRLKQLHGLRRITYLPVALAGFVVTMTSCWLAFRALKQGCTDYWPDTKSRRLAQHLPEADSAAATLTT